jgi:hypothetical protein
LGDAYPYWSQISDVEKIVSLIEQLYLEWLEKQNNAKLNREDLLSYLSLPYLKSFFETLEQDS